MEVAVAAMAALRARCAAESTELGSLEDGDARLAALLQACPPLSSEAIAARLHEISMQD